MKKLVLVSLLATFLFSLISCSPKTPSDIAEAMMSDLKAAKYEKMSEYFYFEDMEQSKAEENKQMIVAIMKDKVGKEYEKKEGIKDFTIVNETMGEDPNEATVEISITFGNGETDTTHMDFIKKDDKWYADLGK